MPALCWPVLARAGPVRTHGCQCRPYADLCGPVSTHALVWVVKEKGVQGIFAMDLSMDTVVRQPLHIIAHHHTPPRFQNGGKKSECETSVSRSTVAVLSNLGAG